jgi:predicted signal transduction protein with EAL and GGDEF domain
LAEPYRVRDAVIPASASVGVALGTGADSVQRLLERADALMYEAKATTEAWKALTANDAMSHTGSN